ncbi:MAG: hypothetical protein ABI758_01145 [Candidatus Woesebacteria bacterium]
MLESGWFSPTLREISAMEQFETIILDASLTEEKRERLLENMWIRLELAHGGRVYSMVSPEGLVIDSPLIYGDEKDKNPGRKKE